MPLLVEGKTLEFEIFGIIMSGVSNEARNYSD